MSELVGLGFTTSDASTGLRLPCDTVIYGGNDLNSRGATDSTEAFEFTNVGAGEGHIEIRRKGYVTRIIPCVFPIAANIDFPMVPDGSGVTGTPRLHVDGLRLRADDNTEYIWAMMSGFRDYQRFLLGEDIRPIFQQARDLGANGRRVLGMFAWSDGPGPFIPQNHPDYYDRLPEFLRLAAAHGLYIQFCVFADTKLVMPTPAEQHVHLARIGDLGAPHDNFLGQLVNENDSNDNGVDIASFSKPGGALWSSGSNGTGNNPPRPFWDYSDLGSERRADRIQLTTSTVFFAIHGYSEGNDNWPGTQRATAVSEPYGIADTPENGRRTNNPYICYQMGVGSRYGDGVGATVHTNDGIQSLFLSPIQAECAKQMILGIKSVTR